MKIRLLCLAFLALCLFSSQAQTTPLDPETVIPIPVNKTIRADLAAANLRNSASKLNETGGRVAIRNVDGTATIVNANDLASDLLNQASIIGKLGSSIKVIILDGGKIPFIYVGPSPPEDNTSLTPTLTTVITSSAPEVPYDIATTANSSAALAYQSASSLDSIDGYVITTSENGTIKLVNASDLAQEARDQADLLSAAGNLTVALPHGGEFVYGILNPLEGFPEFDAIILQAYSNLSIVKQEADSVPTVTKINYTVAPPLPSITRVSAQAVAYNLRDSASKLDEVDGYVVFRKPDQSVSVADAKDLANDLRNQADGYDQLGVLGVIIPEKGYVLFEPLVRADGISSYAFIMDLYGPVSVVNLE